MDSPAIYNTLGICDGVVISRAFVLKKENLSRIVPPGRSLLTFQEEVGRADKAIQKFTEDTYALIAKADPCTEQAMILERHITIANDPEIWASVKEQLENESATCEAALVKTLGIFAEVFACMEDELMKARSQDLDDIKVRLIEILTGKIEHSIEDINSECILVAQSLTPSEMMRLDGKIVKGIVTESGGINSHMSIMAKAMGIPTALGAKGILETVGNGDSLTLNISNGRAEVIVSPSEEEIRKIHALMEEFDIKKKSVSTAVPCEKHPWHRSRMFLNRNCYTVKDKYSASVLISANIGGLWDLDAAYENGADGIGLFRTEFLFMERDSLPDEDKQFEVYKAAAVAMNGKPVTIRTLDIGGDKYASCFVLKKEANPFLGCRGIRICLNEREVFKVQIRAILRASFYGNVKIMLPMVSVLDELRQTKDLIEEAKRELYKEGKPFDNIPIGIMIETPAAAITADILAKECDFFSIGTNDLIQYIMAADRLNESVSHLYSAHQPAVMRTIYNVIKAGKDAGIAVGMCGEAAADINIIPFLLACGLDEFSVSPKLVPETRIAIVDKLEKLSN